MYTVGKHLVTKCKLVGADSKVC